MSKIIIHDADVSLLNNVLQLVGALFDSDAFFAKSIGQCTVTAWDYVAKIYIPTIEQ
jgi:hypothetical protein